jgi:carbamoyltransferase
LAAILGLNAFHPDSAACLVIDGKLVAAVAEERLGKRFKHTASFPEQAVRWVLQEGGITLGDVTHVAIGRDSSVNARARIGYALSKPSAGLHAAKSYFKRRSATHSLAATLAIACGEDPTRFNPVIHRTEHHLAHIASAYYLSPFEELTAGFSIDGSGDFVSAMAARCEGNRIEVLDKVLLPASLGHFYTAMCQFIGFEAFGEEYKVMGLAPYGEDRYAAEMEQIVSTAGREWYQVAGKYLDVWKGLRESVVDDGGEIRMGRIYTAALTRLLGTPRKRADPVTQREMDIARSTQVMFEKAVANCLTTLGKQVPLTRLAMAGGCALNGVMNARAYREFPIEQAWLQAASSDDGTALGAAYHCWHEGLGRTERFHMEHAFWGPGYDHAAIGKAVTASGFTARECASEAEMLGAAADLVAAGMVTGWYQGRSEWGPRALGNRSILANPAVPDMKERINRKIKKRETFRPFAPSLLREDVGKYFEQDLASPFMMHVVKFRPEWREAFPAVTHVDGTGRLQSVEQANNPLYYALLQELKARTGHGMVLNTSFNENEPVVDTPEQAIACFKRTDMDALVLGRYVLVKPGLEPAAASR